ncbi:MAG: hypothetical protein WCR08_02425 [Gammaproteobacteria bacterium]
MPKYHRVLVRYRLPTSDQWSDLHWCDIERTESNEMRVRVACAVQGARMPRDDEFEDLAPESAKKLLVIDCSGPEETSGGWPLRARTSSDFESYCLVFTANAMFRIAFQSQTKLFMQQGQSWVEGNRFNLDNLIRLQHCFTPEEIAADKRLQMRTQSAADNYDLLKYDAELINDLKRQYLESPINHVIHREEVADTVQTAVVDQSHDQTNQDWLTTERRKPVVIDMDSFSSAFEWGDRTLLHHVVCIALSSVKSCSNSPDEYQMALRALLGNAKIPANCSLELITEVQVFRDSMLCNSMDLNTIFAHEVSSHPSLASVCQYVSECVFLELKNQDPSLEGSSSDMFITPCPVSYLEVQLGRRNQQSEVLVGGGLFTDHDAAIAAQLQMEELGGGGLQGARLNSVPSNFSSAVSGFVDGGNSQSDIWGSRLQQRDSTDNDATYAASLQLQEDQDEGLNLPANQHFMPQHGCNVSGGAGARSNPSGSNRVPFYPRQHGRYGFWGHIPSAAPQFNRLLLCCMGAGRCTLGVYLAFSSFFTGAAIIAGGLLCLLAASLAANRNPAPVYGAPSVGFGGF